ncbi:hypothetical protein ACQ3I4_11720 [Zafaria sp. Z1313]|uniref:hypothetical protein n=1 Tax=unclassified Zafaria TaxID=2828765 RepID=UPI002E7A57B9|nr:hypothetical protein [Zafaria sp. J156]MEE1622055.1 hypothetical protein [Zafaria sp. J156]
MSENRITELGPEAHLQLNRVLGTALGVAREQLEANGVFLPFAVALEAAQDGAEGELRLLAVQPPADDDDPEVDIDAEAMMGDLVELLGQQREGFTAIALVSDVTLLEEDRDAVHANAEHSEGGAVAVVQAYTPPAAEGGEWAFAEPAAEAGELLIWG